jgi:hypothetical protein
MRTRVHYRTAQTQTCGPGGGQGGRGGWEGGNRRRVRWGTGMAVHMGFLAQLVCLSKPSVTMVPVNPSEPPRAAGEGGAMRTLDGSNANA